MNLDTLIEAKRVGEEVIPVVNLRSLHKLLEVKRKFADWIKDKLKNYTEGEHYVMIPFRNESNGKVSVSKEYYILLDIAKEIAKDRTALVDYLTECQEKYEPERYGQKALLDKGLIVVEKRYFGEGMVSVVDSRALWEALESKQDYSTWIKRRIEKLRLLENRDFYAAPQTYGANQEKVKRIDFYVVLDVAKHIAMMENTDRGFQVREYFIRCEKELLEGSKRESIKDQCFLDIIYAKSNEETALAIQTLNREVIVPLEQKVDELEEGIRKANLQRGKALYELVQQHHKSFYYDLILNTPDMFTVTEVASDYGLSAKDLNKILEEEKIQYKKGGRWYLYTKYSKLGLAKARTYVCTCDKHVHHSVQGLKWTQKGRLFIYDLLKKREILPIGRFHNKIQHWRLEVLSANEESNPVYSPARLAASIAWASE